MNVSWLTIASLVILCDYYSKIDWNVANSGDPVCSQKKWWWQGTSSLIKSLQGPPDLDGRASHLPPHSQWQQGGGILPVTVVGDVTHNVRSPVHIFCGWCHTQGQASCLYLLWVMSHTRSGLLFISFVGDVARKFRPPVYIFCGWCHTQGQASCLYLLWVMSHRTRSGFLSVSFVGDVTTRSGLLPVAVACGATLPTDNQCLTCTFTDRAMHCSMEHVWLTGCWNPNSQFIVQGQIICTLDHKWESREFMSHWYPVAFGGPAPLLPHIRQCQGLNHNGKASITQSPSNHITGV